MTSTFKFLIILTFLAMSGLFYSCKSFSQEHINLSGRVEWALANTSSPPKVIYENPGIITFEPLEFYGRNNLKNLVGFEGTYIWLRAKFMVPDSLRNKDLALYIVYLSFADEVYLNGEFIGKEGDFPPREISSEKATHFYPMYKDLLKADEENTLLLKVWCHGNASLSDKIIIGEYRDVKRRNDFGYFFLNTFYILFEGGLIGLFLLYLLLFINQREKKEFLFFSMMNLFTAQFSCVLFSPLLPFYKNGLIPYIWFYKYFGCFCFYAICFFLSSFVDSFLKIKRSLVIQIMRTSIFVIQSIVTFALPEYNVLYQSTVYMLILVILQGIPAFYDLIRSLISPDREKQHNAHILLYGIVTFLFTITIDVYLRVVKGNQDHPFFSFYGWLIAMVEYLIVLSVRFGKMNRTNSYLTENLQLEVESQTSEIQKANDKLEDELFKNHMDLKMAALVQKKTFDPPVNNFIGWDIATIYEPLAEVSGDMYDFYNMGHILEGFSLFDVSGHGIAASLITMLSKTIIYRQFRSCMREGKSSSEMMRHINTNLIKAKGDAENYLTGLMFQIDTIERNEKCKIEFANGGHPHPILYNSERRACEILFSANAVNQYGVIGIKDLDVSFQDVSFTMGVGDILVCFTDGLLETKNEEGKQFGKDNVIRVIEANAEGTAVEICDALKSSLNFYRGSVPMEDDLTILVLKRQNTKDFLEEI